MAPVKQAANRAANLTPKQIFDKFMLETSGGFHATNEDWTTVGRDASGFPVPKGSASDVTAKAYDAARPRVVPEATDVARFRVMRPIWHGVGKSTTQLNAGELVDMSAAAAQHLVETNALAPHVTPVEVDRVVKIGVTGAVTAIAGVEAAITGAEAAAAAVAPGATAPDATIGTLEVDTAGNVQAT